MDGMPDLGASSNIVLQVASIIPQQKDVKLYHDNWFTSIGLEVEMAKNEDLLPGYSESQPVEGVFTEK